MAAYLQNFTVFNKKNDINASAKPSASEVLPVKSYMFVHHPGHNRALNVQTLFNGGLDDYLCSLYKNKRLNRHNNYQIYVDLNTLLKHHPVPLANEQGAYILRLGLDIENVYQLIGKGQFHIAIIDAVNHRQVILHRRGSSLDIEIIPSKNFRLELPALNKIISSSKNSG